MRRIGWKERKRRMLENQRAAWEASGVSLEDPGLRDAYETIPRAPIRLISCPLGKDVNQGGLLRIADAFRLERVSLSSHEQETDFSGHRGACVWQPYEWAEPESAIAQARSDGYHLVAVTLSARSVAIEHYPWQFPLALVVGSELDGVPVEIERSCDGSVGIPLYGLMMSLNVATATAIVVNEAVRAYARHEPEFRPVRAASRNLLDSGD